MTSRRINVEARFVFCCGKYVLTAEETGMYVVNTCRRIKPFFEPPDLKKGHLKYFKWPEVLEMALCTGYLDQATFKKQLYERGTPVSSFRPQPQPPQQG